MCIRDRYCATKGDILRVIALDVGDRRIGLALSDPTELIATPLAHIIRTTTTVDVRLVISTAQYYSVRGILIGMPFSSNGRIGTQAKKIMRFSRLLEERTGIPIIVWDERYTTVAAENLLREAGLKPSLSLIHI